MITSLFKWVKKISLLAWLILMLVGGAWVSIENSQTVSLTLFSFGLPEYGVGLVLWVTLLSGVLLGFFTCYLVTRPAALANKRRLHKATKEVALLRKPAK